MKKKKYLIISTVILAFLIAIVFLGPHILGYMYKGDPVIGTYRNTTDGHMIFVDDDIYFISPNSEKSYIMSQKADNPMFKNLEDGDKIFVVLSYYQLDSLPPIRGANFCIKIKNGI